MSQLYRFVLHWANKCKKNYVHKECNRKVNYFTDSMIFYHEETSYKFRFIKLKFIRFSFCGEVHRVVFFHATQQYVLFPKGYANSVHF